MVGQGFGRKSGLRMYVEPFRWECTAQKHCVLGLAEIPSLPHSLPDDRMRHIFFRDFRKDFIQQMAQYHCILDHNVIPNNEIVLIFHRFPVWILHKNFHCIFDTLFAEIGDKIFTFWNFLARNRWFFPLHSPWDFFLMKINFEWFFGLFDDFSPSSVFGKFWVSFTA